MADKRPLFLGTDCGATTSKIVAVYEDGTPVSTKLLQRKTRSEGGRGAIVEGWVEAVGEYLAENDCTWDQVQTAGLATPGPYERYGVMAKSPNMPQSLAGFDVHSAYKAAISQRVGREVPVVVGNDGNLGGVAEAARVRGDSDATVVMLAPGSGLGGAFIDGNGLPLEGNTFGGGELGHLPAPLNVLDAKPYLCGCGRDWGCFEVYTSLSGLPALLTERLERHPDHPLASSPASPKDKALSLRGLAQQGDELAMELFDFQARALGICAATCAMAFDPKFFVIGGGLMDPESTSEAFRKRYLDTLTAAAMQYAWPSQRDKIHFVPAALGELSQAIGAALVGLYSRNL
ncbi:MAG: ROK family protein [Phycisphaerae bacterium]